MGLNIFSFSIKIIVREATKLNMERIKIKPKIAITMRFSDWLVLYTNWFFSSFV